MKKTTILFTIDDKYSPHWQITPEYDTEADKEYHERIFGKDDKWYKIKLN